MITSDRFDRFNRANVIPALRILLAISTNCGFFRSQVYESIRLGSILATEDMPIPNRLSSIFSIYAFLSTKPGSDNPSLLPGEGWRNILDP